MAEAELITGDGEVIETGLPMIVDDAMAGTLARAEIDTQIATARQYPRSVKRAMDNIGSLATLDEETAEECIYALKRGGKPIRGPSIRLAEIIQQQWGNNRTGAVVTSIDRVNKIIVAEGFFHDLETNSATRASVQRRISDSKGRLFSDDMIAVTGNAACSIAKRNAILAGVPKGIWRKAVAMAEQVIRGDIKTLAERRAFALSAFAHFNLSKEDIFAVMEVEGEDDIGIDDLVTLKAMFSNLKNGETTAEELLRGTKAARPTHAVVENALQDKVPEKAKKPDEAKTEAPKEKAEPEKKVEPEKAKEGAPSQAEALPAADPIEAARERGRKAKAAGMARKAVPTEYRAKDRTAEAEAWQAGYDEPAREREPGEEG